MEWGKLRLNVLCEVEPSAEEEEKIRSFSESLLQRINEALHQSGIKGKAELHGSVAHGTWISGSQDLDVFIVLEGRDRELLTRVLSLIREKIEGDFMKAYAEHPYLKSVIDGFNVDFVPCFKIDPGEKIISSTDRTPLHSEYLKKYLDYEKRNEVRLLKKFVEGIGVYGAEIKVGGFSGYLCELLILRYGSLWCLLEASREWRRGLELTLTVEPAEEFNDPLVFVDPVDCTRNVSSALSEKNFWTFIYAAECFLEEPKKIFFFPEPYRISRGEFLEKLVARGTDLVFLIVEESRAEVADTLWGMLYKSRDGLEKALTDGGFNVLKSCVWSDERSRHIFTFELDEEVIPEVSKHYGPPCRFRKGSKDFIATHLGSEKTLSGPEIEEDRWYILNKIKHVNAVEFLKEKLTDGGVGVGVSRPLAIRILQHHRLLVNLEIEEYMDEDFLSHLNNFLIGRPKWIE